MKTCLAVSAILGLGMVPLFAVTTFIVEGGPNGQNPANYFDTGWGASVGTVLAPGCTSTGTRYSSTTTLFGPSRYAEASYAPTVTGYYEADIVWTPTAGQSHTAVNLYTGSATGGPPDRWGNPNGPEGIIASAMVNQYYSGLRYWIPIAVTQFSAGTTYHVGVYGGYQTPYAGGVTPADTVANRVTLGGVRFIAVTPAAVAYAGPGNGATEVALYGNGNDLSWGAGAYSSFFDIWFGTTSGSLAKVATIAEGSPLMWDPESLGPLSLNTQYYWRIDAGNVDAYTPGPEYSFTTTVIPEPSTAALGLLGGLGWAAWIYRRRARSKFSLPISFGA